MPRQPLIIHDEDLVTKTLDTIAAERRDFDRSFDFVDEVIRKFREAGLAESLYTQSRANGIGEMSPISLQS